MELNPESVWTRDHGIMGAGFRADLNTDCVEFCLTTYRKKLTEFEQQLEDEIESERKDRSKLRALHQKLSEMHGCGLLDEDRPVRSIVNEISGLSESIKIGETSITSTINSQIKFYRDLVDKTEARLQRLRALEEYGGES